MRNSDIKNIGGYEFDLSQKVYLHHPNNKFWQVALNQRKVTYRVGKFKQDSQIDIQQVSKQYSKASLAKQKIEEKILEKLTKGYFSKTIKHQSQKPKQEKIQVIKMQQKKQQKKQTEAFSGQFYEKQNQSIKLQVNDNKVKITRVSQNGKKEGFQIRNFANNQKAVVFCLQEQAWYISQGYKANSRKFINTFVDSKKQQQKTQIIVNKQTKKKQDSIKTRPNTNLLSITHMTDEAISHRSRNNSSCKSDRSFNDDGNDNINDYKSSKLGPASSSCINVLLAQTWNDQVDPEGWIMSEKLDGVRCFWTGTMMYSRNANRFYPPKFFTQNWPKSQLDGQLFIQRGQFSKTISAVKKNVPIDDQWKNVKFLVFDAPGLKKPFKQRIKIMQEIIKNIDNDYIKCHYHRQCKGYTDLFEELDKVNKIQGQGLMLRNPQSFYENKRSKSLLKVKTFHDDEAVVLGYKPGTGRCQGMVGALKVRNTHGIQFQVGSGLNDDMRRKPPKIGSKITYKYQQFIKGSGKPRFPTFLRVFQQKI